MKKYDIKIIFVSRTLDFVDAEKRVNDELADGCAGGGVKLIQSGGVKLIRPYVQWSPVYPIRLSFGDERPTELLGVAARADGGAQETWNCCATVNEKGCAGAFRS